MSASHDLELLERIRALPSARPLLAGARDTAGVHLVGGAVRDLLLGESPVDLDLVVEGDAATFARSLGGDVRVHDRFGTSTVTLDGVSYDVARARRETYAHPGALPDVAPAGLEEDLRRRDFTVNAMAVGLADGRFTSVPQARADLEGRRLRVLHDASFLDDPTRMLRLARYASRLGFAVEQHTRGLLAVAVSGGALGTVSGNRTGAELRLLAREPDPVAALGALGELGLAAAIHPGFGLADEASTRRALALLGDAGRPDLLALAAALLGVPPIERPRLLDALAFPAHERDTILAAAGRSEELARALGRARAPSEIAAAAAGAEPELVALAGALGPAEPARAWLTQLHGVRLEIDGEDLLASGVPAGPALGRGLRAALAAKLDGQVDGREAELAVAVQAAREAAG